MAADGDKDQEKEVTEEMGRASEELNWEELRAELFHILLELEETREASVRYQRDYLDLQGEFSHGGLQGGRGEPACVPGRFSGWWDHGRTRQQLMKLC